MRVKFKIEPDKSYRKLKRIVSKEIYKNNKYSKILKICDLFGFFLFGALVATLYNYYEDLYDLFYYYNDFLSLFCIFIVPFLLFYALIIRAILWSKALNLQVYDKFDISEFLVEILEDGLLIKTENVSSVYSFKSITKVEHINNFLVIIIQNATFIVIPDSAFCEFSKDEFKDKLNEKCKLG